MSAVYPHPCTYLPKASARIPLSSSRALFNVKDDHHHTTMPVNKKQASSKYHPHKHERSLFILLGHPKPNGALLFPPIVLNLKRELHLQFNRVVPSNYAPVSGTHHHRSM